jgi:hypothetical protein
MSHPVVFVSYSHKDEVEKEQLVGQLKVLEMAGVIKLWVDDRIEGGADWTQEIEEAIASASAAILLISANFLTSKFILGEEVPAFLKRRQNEGLTVFPVIAKPCAWDAFDWLQKMNVRPKNGRPIWSGTPSQIEADLATIVKEVADMVKKQGGAVTPPAAGSKASSAAVTPPAAKTGQYSLRAIRKLLTDTFSDEALRTLCYDMPQFRPVYEQFSAGMTKTQMIQLLLEFGERKGLLADLLVAARDESPEKYADFEASSGNVAVLPPANTPASPLGTDQVDHLITLKTRRLYELQKKAALYGLSTPPEIAIEIEDLQTEIAELKRQHG